jgi:coproporphyrinogen III oxidase-like Fe-S oxidoreductase
VQHTDKIKDWHGLKQYGTDDEVYDEFSYLKELLLQSKYRRYELSNFSLTGKSSVHNRAYREMESYLWLGSWASWFINSNHQQYNTMAQAIIGDDAVEVTQHWLRRTNTKVISNYMQWNYINQKETILLSEKDYQIEEFFLSLRTDKGVLVDDTVASILVKNYKEIADQLAEQWFIRDDVRTSHNKLQLTDQWMDVYNEIVTNLLEEI